MANQSPSRSGRIYISQESTFGTAVAPTGSNCCRFIEFTPKPNVQLITRDDKTGDLDATPGITGKKSTSFDLSMNLAPNGAAGTASDANLVLANFMGAAPTIVASTSVSYATMLASGSAGSLNIWHYRLPSTVNQQVLLGAIVNTLGIEINGAGGAGAQLKFGGFAEWACESNAFSSLDTIGKGGLGSFPAEPGSPVTNGAMVANYKGLFKIGSNTFSNLKMASLTLNNNRSPVDDTFSTDYMTGVNYGVRDYSGTMEIYDQDDANTQAIWASSITKTPINITIQIGTIAGAITTVTLGNVQIASPVLKSNGDKNWTFSIEKSRATASAIGANNALTIVQT